MDITQLIADDHAEQRRLFALIDELTPERPGRAEGRVGAAARVARHPCAGGGALLLSRAAEDRPRRRRRKPAEETRDAIKDHNEIRDTAADVDREGARLDEWFEAVAACNKANSDHMAEEERQGLTDFRRHADLELRHRPRRPVPPVRIEHLTGTA